MRSEVGDHGIEGSRSLLTVHVYTSCSESWKKMPVHSAVRALYVSMVHTCQLPSKKEGLCFQKFRTLCKKYGQECSASVFVITSTRRNKPRLLSATVVPKPRHSKKGGVWARPTARSEPRLPFGRALAKSICDGIQDK